MTAARNATRPVHETWRGSIDDAFADARTDVLDSGSGPSQVRDRPRLCVLQALTLTGMTVWGGRCWFEIANEAQAVLGHGRGFIVHAAFTRIEKWCGRLHPEHPKKGWGALS